MHWGDFQRRCSKTLFAPKFDVTTRPLTSRPSFTLPGAPNSTKQNKIGQSELEAALRWNSDQSLMTPPQIQPTSFGAELYGWIGFLFICAEVLVLEQYRCISQAAGKDPP
jgi:hypothetical protein